MASLKCRVFRETELGSTADIAVTVVIRTDSILSIQVNVTHVKKSEGFSGVGISVDLFVEVVHVVIVHDLGRFVSKYSSVEVIDLKGIDCWR